MHAQHVRPNSPPTHKKGAPVLHRPENVGHQSDIFWFVGASSWRVGMFKILLGAARHSLAWRALYAILRNLKLTMLLMVVTHSQETCARNLHEFLAQVSCIKFSCTFMQVRLTTHPIKRAFLDETDNFLNTFCRPLHGNTEFLLE